MNLTYPATVTPDTGGQWLVTFPDIPEAVSAGDSKEDALAYAPAALETALEFYTDAGEDLPTRAKATPATTWSRCLQFTIGRDNQLVV